MPCLHLPALPYWLTYSDILHVLIVIALVLLVLRKPQEWEEETEEEVEGGREGKEDVEDERLAVLEKRVDAVEARLRKM